MLMIVRILSVALLVFSAGVVSGQNYPTKPIRIVTSGVGGGNDFVARLVAQGLTGPLGQQVIVDNRGGGLVTGEVVSKASPDGYTLLVNGASIWLGPLIQNASYDPVRDFSPISIIEQSPQVLVVHPSVPANSVKELIALAKARPGELNFGTGATGSSNHLAAESFKTMAGINIVRIRYKGTGQTVTALLTGEVHLIFSNTPAVAPHVKSGRLKALAISSTEPWEQLPGVPTISASGLPGFESISITGLFAPAKTPNAIISRLNQDVVRVLSSADLKQKFIQAGMQAVGSSPEALAAFIKSDMSKRGKVIKDVGIAEK